MLSSLKIEMTEEVVNNKSSQLVGNMGLYYICFELSKRGWNAIPLPEMRRELIL